jgi:hypothetical protein
MIFPFASEYVHKHLSLLVNTVAILSVLLLYHFSLLRLLHNLRTLTVILLLSTTNGIRLF